MVIMVMAVLMVVEVIMVGMDDYARQCCMLVAMVMVWWLRWYGGYTDDGSF